MANQISTMVGLHCFGPTVDLASHEREVEHAEDEIETGEPDEREDGAALAHDMAGAVAGTEQAVHEPRLAAELRGHPAHGFGDERERKREHEGPEQAAAGFEAATEA